MGKKRKPDQQQRDEDPPEFATEKEKKKTRVSNYGVQSTESLLNKEQEVTRELVDLQTQLSHKRSSSAVSYGNNELRQMNTKRYRAEYALGEIKAEIERRARKKLGQSVPKEGIQGGSTAGVAATTTTNQAHQKVREVNAACSSVLQQSLREPQAQGGKGSGKFGGTGGMGGGGLRHSEPNFLQQRQIDGTSEGYPPGGGGVLRSPEEMQMQQGSMPSMPSQPAAMPQAFLQAPPQMNVNFASTPSAVNAMAMMGAMGPGAMAGPSPEEMVAASRQFQQMMQLMGGGNGASPGAFMQPAVAQAPAAPISSNVPAAFRRNRM